MQLHNRPGQRAVVRTIILLAVASAGLGPAPALAGPSAEVARRCMHYSYLAYPYKRPGSVRMSGDRQAYFRDCMEKEGNVPAPEQPKS
jgi:hypothetical protein